MRSAMYDVLASIAKTEFGDIVTGWEFVYRKAATPLKLRLTIRDGTFVDIWLSPDTERYSYHWEQRAARGLIHQHDNAPDHPEVFTFPKHFHDGQEDNVRVSSIPDDAELAVREFLSFVRSSLERSSG